MQKEFQLTVDIEKKILTPSFEVNTLDLKTIKLKITITRGMTLVDLTGITVRMSIRKPDGNVLFQDCQITNAKGGQVEITLENQAYVLPGSYSAEIMCFKGSDKVAVTGSFSYRSIKGIMDDKAVESKSEFTAITGMIKDTQDTIEDLRKNGTGIDAQARQEVQQVTEKLAEIAMLPQLSGRNNGKVINDTIQTVKNLGGGTVLLPKGEIEVEAPIRMESQVILKGSGRDVTILRPTFSSGNVIEGGSSMKQKPRIEDLTIKPGSYQYGLIGINYKYFQYASVHRVDVWRCGVGYDYDGSVGCYYNKQMETRAIGCAYGWRSKDAGGVARANANETDDLTIISPVIGVFHDSGNTNILRNIKIESLEGSASHPTVDPNGSPVTEADRWVLKLTRGTGNRFEKFRSEFNGNLVSTGNTYGNFLKDFYCNYNGNSGDFIEFVEQPTNRWQTNNLDDVELGYSMPVLTHKYFSRRSRLGQEIQFPPQISMTPRDSAGAPTSGKKGLMRMDSNADLFVATADNAFKKIFYEAMATYNQKGLVYFSKNSANVEERTIAAGTHTSIGISLSGMQTTDSINLSTTVRVPNGLIVHPPQIQNYTVVVFVYNPTNSPVVLPAGTWTAAYTRV